jgi:hypothetical protein
MRSYDIMSLGCLYTDLSVWSAEGKSDYRKFAEKK